MLDPRGKERIPDKLSGEGSLSRKKTEQHLWGEMRLFSVPFPTDYFQWELNYITWLKDRISN